MGGGHRRGRVQCVLSSHASLCPKGLCRWCTPAPPCAAPALQAVEAERRQIAAHLAGCRELTAAEIMTQLTVTPESEVGTHTSLGWVVFVCFWEGKARGRLVGRTRQMCSTPLYGQILMALARTVCAASRTTPAWGRGS